MLNINIIYIYPKKIDINNEINLFRIIDTKLKETIVFFAINKNKKYEIYISNTMTGKNINICNVNNESELEGFLNKFKEYEKEIKGLKDLDLIEKYILKLV